MQYKPLILITVPLQCDQYWDLVALISLRIHIVCSCWRVYALAGMSVVLVVLHGPTQIQFLSGSFRVTHVSNSGNSRAAGDHCIVRSERIGHYGGPNIDLMSDGKK